MRRRSEILLNAASNNTSPAAAPDLAYAPPSFQRPGGGAVVFVDFTQADYDIRIRRHDEVGKVEIRVQSRLEFLSVDEGHPAFCLRQPIASLSIDGRQAGALSMQDPDGVSEFKVIDRLVPPGTHTLVIESTIERLPESTFDPVRWVGRPAGVQCLFEMSDRGIQKGFLDSYLPSNFEYDHIAMSLLVTLEGVSSALEDVSSAHRIISNGVIEVLDPNRWRVVYPPHYTCSSILFHLAPVLLYDTLEAVHSPRVGPSIPVMVYARREQIGFGDIRLEDYRDAALSALRDLENNFGPFPHSRVIIYAKGPGTGGMEYAGATVSRIDSIRHELDHSYFARCVTPANGDAGWMDEAIASWGDKGYKAAAARPDKGANMAKRSPYERTTSPHAYTIGRDLIAHLDHLSVSQGGMRLFLKRYFDTKRFSSVDAAEFQHMVEDFHGQSLQALFDEFVYNEDLRNGVGDGGDPDQPAHH